MQKLSKLSDENFQLGITFDDVLLEPRYSAVVPNEVDVSTLLTRRIKLTIPFLSSPMDTVTECSMAVALAQQGGMGIIHKNLTIDQQAKEVAQAKRTANGIIFEPACLPPEVNVQEAKKIMDHQNISAVPIVDAGNKLCGIITRRDLRFLENWNVPIAEVMTSKNLVTVTGKVSLTQAEKILMEKKVEKLLLVDENNRLTGLITIKDIDMLRRFPNACKDGKGRLRVGAAVGVHDYERVERLLAEDVDVLVVDSAHGHSKNVLETVAAIKKRWDVDVVAGNIATEDGCKALIDAGADAVKVGIGPGSICTTRVVSGVGVPQITAICRVAEFAADYAPHVSIIADGGIRYSGDISKAIAAGAHVCMIGGLFAGLNEAPGDLILYQGRTFKAYRGMGSLGAMVQGSSERYRQSSDDQPDKLVPEGVEGRVPYKGALGPFVYQLVGGLRAGMGYCGTQTIEEMRKETRFIRITAASMKESHPHDIAITQEAPNYSSEEE